MSTSNQRRPQKRRFETQGNPIPGQHYLVENRHIVNQDGVPIEQLIGNGRYFTIFAPRQMGKTTFFVEFARELRRNPLYVPILLSFQIAKSFDSLRLYEMIQRDMTSQLLQRLQEVKYDKTSEVSTFCQQARMVDQVSFQLFFTQLDKIIQRKKIVIFIDAFDDIPEKELGDFLNTVREIYLTNKRLQAYSLYSLGLAGIRNITRLNISGIVSPFNIAEQVLIPLANIVDQARHYRQTLARIVLTGNVKHNLRYEEIADLDLFGLIKAGPQGVAQPANPIYQRIFLDVFELDKTQQNIRPEFVVADYILDDGQLDMVAVLHSFSAFIQRLGVNLFAIFPGAPQEAIGQYLLLAYVDLIVKSTNGDSNKTNRRLCGKRRLKRRLSRLFRQSPKTGADY